MCWFECFQFYFWFSIKLKHHEIEAMLQACKPSHHGNQLIEYHLPSIYAGNRKINRNHSHVRNEVLHIHLANGSFGAALCYTALNCTTLQITHMIAAFIYKIYTRIELKYFKYVVYCAWWIAQSKPKENDKEGKERIICLWLLWTKTNSDIRRYTHEFIDENVNGKIPHKFAFNISQMCEHDFTLIKSHGNSSICAQHQQDERKYWNND